MFLAIRESFTFPEMQEESTILALHVINHSVEVESRHLDDAEM
jgi:hypothetical protein